MKYGEPNKNPKPDPKVAEASPPPKPKEGTKPQCKLRKEPEYNADDFGLFGKQLR
jgi:hypothetical protein